MELKLLCRWILTSCLSNHEAGKLCHVAPNTARRYRQRLSEEGLTWEQAQAMSDEALAARLNNGRERCRKRFVEPDWPHVQRELSRTGVTLTLLYEKYSKAAGSGYMSEREFRRRYARYRRSQGLVMRQPLRPGEQLFVDYSGKRPSLTDRQTGEKTPVELFVSAMGASRKTFAYATLTQKLPDWIDAHVHAFEFYGVAPHFLVPDNLKSGVVTIQKRVGHVINPTYQDFANHYDVMVMPTRARAPRDKAAVESAVRLAQRWILARLRNRTFYALAELNAAIAELVAQLNNKPMRSRGGKNRNEMFEELDRPAMKPLPQQRYEFAEWRIGVVVPNDYCVAWERHYYSVPNHLVSSKVDIRATTTTVECYHRGKLVAGHARSDGDDGITIHPDHQPPAHRIFTEEKKEELLAWARTQGPSVSAFLQQHLQVYPQVASLQAYQGLKRMARDFGVKRLDRACWRAIQLGATRVSSVNSMLVHGLEDRPLEDAANDPAAEHENVRGPKAYK